MDWLFALPVPQSAALLALGSFASPHLRAPCLHVIGEDRRQMAAGALGELVRKLGDRVVQQMVPILRAGMDAPHASTRQGVCYGLKELLDNITRTQLGQHLPALLPTVQAALTDPDPTVRAVRVCIPTHPSLARSSRYVQPEVAIVHGL